MQEAVPVGKGAMAAVIGAPLIEIERVCVEAAEGEICSPANINSANQIVIAGDASAIDRAIEKLQGIAKKVVRLNVSAPFHCLLMLPAQQRLAVDLEQMTFSAPSIPVVANVSAAPVISAVESRRALIEQVSAPVRWQQSIEFLIKEGMQTFVEVGPGKVLCGLMRQINREVKCVNIEDSTSLAQVQTCMTAL
jgi:[acyl-carrier-protein] S-malonyltransferase